MKLQGRTKAGLWLGWVLGMLAAAPADAIVNVEQAIIGKTEPGLHGGLSVLANGSSGNSEKSLVKMEGLLLWQHDAHTEFVQLHYASGQSRGRTDTDRAFLHVRHRTMLDMHWGMEAFAQTGHDRFARLSQRTLAGGGVRRVLYEEEGKAATYLGLGAFHEREILNEQFGTSDDLYVQRWRANSYLVVKRRLGETLRFSNTLYYQPALGDGGNYRVLEQASLLFRLAERLDFKLNLEMAVDSHPPQTVQVRDVFYSTGLEWEF